MTVMINEWSEDQLTEQHLSFLRSHQAFRASPQPYSVVPWMSPSGRPAPRMPSSSCPALPSSDVSMVATTFVDNAGITRVKSVPLSRLPQLAAWGVGASTSFDYFRFDDWLAAPEGGTAPVGDLRIIPDLRRLVALAAQPGWAWTPGDRYRQDGEPHERCNRLALQRLVDDAVGNGLEIKAAIEIEWVVSAGEGDDFVSAAPGRRVRHDSA